MTKHLESFIVRCWRLADGEQRIEIEHIQSGHKQLAHSAAEAIECLCAARHGTAGTTAKDLAGMTRDNDACAARVAANSAIKREVTIE